MDIKEFFACYWGAVLTALLGLVNLWLFISYHGWWNLLAAVFITGMCTICVIYGNSTRRSRAIIRKMDVMIAKWEQSRE